MFPLSRFPEDSYISFRQKFFHINGLLKRSILVKLNNFLLFIAKPVLFILFSKIYLLEFSSVESVRAFLNIYMLGFSFQASFATFKREMLGCVPLYNLYNSYNSYNL